MSNVVRHTNPKPKKGDNSGRGGQWGHSEGWKPTKEGRCTLAKWGETWPNHAVSPMMNPEWGSGMAKWLKTAWHGPHKAPCRVYYGPRCFNLHVICYGKCNAPAEHGSQGGMAPFWVIGGRPWSYFGTLQTPKDQFGRIYAVKWPPMGAYRGLGAQTL